MAKAKQPTNPVLAARDVVADKQAKKVDGTLLDLTTASLIVRVYRALSPANRARLEQMDVVKAANICWKLVK